MACEMHIPIDDDQAEALVRMIVIHVRPGDVIRGEGYVEARFDDEADADRVSDLLFRERDAGMVVFEKIITMDSQ